jgi:membrane-bound ClpP family serine protease
MPDSSSEQKPLFISFSAEINQHTIESFKAAIAEQFNKGVRDFYILLSTPGGSVSVLFQHILDNLVKI